MNIHDTDIKWLFGVAGFIAGIFVTIVGMSAGASS